MPSPRYDDRLVLIYSQTPRGKDGVSGRVLYVGVQGGEKNLECFVFQQSDGEFACVSRRRSGPLADGRQRHGDAGQRRHDLDLRPTHASDS